MTILLVNPPISALGGQLYHCDMPPLGLGYLASVAREHGFEVEVLDLGLSEDPRCALDARLAHATLVGLTCYTENFSQALLVAKIAKQQDGLRPVVIGGPHVTHSVDDTLQHPEFDVVVRHEGEGPFIALAHKIAAGDTYFGDIPGIAFQSDQGIELTPPARALADLDRLPFPARDLLPLAEYARPGAISTSRGCPYQCVFCPAAFSDAAAYRARTSTSIALEMSVLHDEFGLERAFVVDDCFILRRERVIDICDRIFEAAPGLRWVSASRVDVVDKRLLNKMHDAGCEGIEFGVESGDAAVLEQIGKRITKDQVRTAVVQALDCGILPVCNFLLGLPHDTWDSMMRTIEFARQLMRLGAGANFSVVTPFPGTPLYANKEKFGLTICADSWDDFRLSNPICNTAHLTRDQIRKAIVMAATMD